jgi:hypothetical protein
MNCWIHFDPRREYEEDYVDPDGPEAMASGELEGEVEGDEEVEGEGEDDAYTVETDADAAAMTSPSDHPNTFADPVEGGAPVDTIYWGTQPAPPK